MTLGHANGTRLRGSWEPRAAEHLALEHLDAVDVAFHDTGVPGQGQVGDGVKVAFEVLGDCGYVHDKYRRLRIRWEIRDDIHEAFLILGCALICWRRVKSPRQVFPGRPGSVRRATC
ncbi:hypothetical protein ACFU8W_39965 [Streptomyces sp. NPDC057565]|uniref:hypothetical protein n=1 Tax=Streptomyces sp. NPDC057565 TaxID=3346169 RepID=UPI0036AAA424